MSNTTYSNPWAGLSPYQDPESSDTLLKFCGRNNESFDVTQLIDDNIFVTLYGKSGTGKTSLLNAGVFPRLRQNQYLPVSIRLGMDAIGISFQQCILTKLSIALQGKGEQTTIEVVPMSADEQSTEYLWSFFARTKFCNNEGQVLFPVLVFDQFEEVFRNRRQDAEVLLRQIHFMMDENHALSDRTIDGVSYQYDFNFRFIVSIREDDLYRMEDCIDNCYLPDMKRCRYRLRGLTEDGARDAILIPGEGLFRTDDQEYIANTIINMARNKEDQSISTNLLSLVSSRIFVDYVKSGNTYITPTLVDTFIKGNPFERFYDEATRGFSNREKSYIEDNLVDSTGRRNSIPEGDFLLHVPKGKQLLEGNSRILQRTSTSSDGSSYRIELIHDSFCKPLAGQKAKREKRRNMIQALLFAFCSIVILTISYLIVHTMSLQQDKMLVNQSRFIAEKAISEIDNGDSYMARLLALNVLPKDLSHADRPYVAEAEIALRKANMQANGIMRGHRAVVTSVYFSQNGENIISVSKDTTVRIWETKTGQCLHILQGHSDAITSTSISADGKYIITGSDDKTIRIWDTSSGKCRYILRGHTGGVTGTFFSGNDSKVFSCSKDKTIRCWDLKEKRCLSVWRGHDDWVNNIALSPDKKLLISVSEDNTIRLWDTTSGSCLHLLERNREKVYDALFSPDGQYIISSWDEQIYQWHIPTKTWLTPLKGHTEPISQMLFTPNKKHLVSSSWDNTIRIWDYQTSQCLHVLKGHTDKANCLSFSADGKTLVSSSYDKTVRIWDISAGVCTRVLSGHTDKIHSSDISPDGKFIVSASSDKTVRLWDISSSGKTLQGHIPSVGSATFSPDGKKVVSAFANVISIWDVASGKCQHILKDHSKDITSLRFTKDGERFLSASSDGTIRLWQLTTGKCLKVLHGHPETIKAIEISPDGRQLVSFSENHLLVWNLQTGEKLYTLKGHKDRINQVVFNPSESQLISASNDSTVRLWDLSSGSCLQTIKGHNDWVTFTCFTPKRHNILTISMDDTLRIWNPDNGKLLKKSFSYYIHQAVISPDGKRIITALRDKSLCLRDAETGECLSSMAGHKEKISTLAFSSDNTKIVSASKDMTVRIWDATTGTCLQIFDGYTSPLVSVGFSPDSHQIVSATYDGTIRIWDFPSLQVLIDQTRERFKNRQLTPEERKKYYLE